MLQRILRQYLRAHLKPEIFGPGWMGIIRQGMTENPAITVSVIMMPILPTVFWPIILYRKAREDRDKPRYVFRYTIFRLDDPRVDMYNYPPAMKEEIREMRKEAIRQKLTAAA